MHLMQGLVSNTTFVVFLRIRGYPHFVYKPSFALFNGDPAPHGEIGRSVKQKTSSSFYGGGFGGPPPACCWSSHRRNAWCGTCGDPVGPGDLGVPGSCGGIRCPSTRPVLPPLQKMREPKFDAAVIQLCGIAVSSRGLRSGDPATGSSGPGSTRPGGQALSGGRLSCDAGAPGNTGHLGRYLGEPRRPLGQGVRVRPPPEGGGPAEIRREKLPAAPPSHRRADSFGLRAPPSPPGGAGEVRDLPWASSSEEGAFRRPSPSSALVLLRLALRAALRHRSCGAVRATRE